MNNQQIEENEAAIEQPPAYEDPPDYEESLSSLKFDMTIEQPSTSTLETQRKRRRSRSRSRSRLAYLYTHFSLATVFFTASFFTIHYAEVTPDNMK